uniref:C-type lectin domain-containing protein n=1 Tax=Steinernema glaseri TaxID=37863 RepID=A0A1I7ZXD3_9BILA
MQKEGVYPPSLNGCHRRSTWKPFRDVDLSLYMRSVPIKPPLEMRFFRLLMLLLSLCCEETEQVRYSLLPVGIIVGTQREVGLVGSKTDCMVQAFNENMIAFTIKEDGSKGKICSLVDGIKGFEERAKNVSSYLLDWSTQNDDQCDSEIDVRKFLEGKEGCDLPAQICTKMEKLHTYCKQSANNAKCMVSCAEGEMLKGPDFTSCCPFTVKVDGTQVCCPEKMFPGKDMNGTSLCCPEKGSCCPQVDGPRVCCPEKMFPGKDKNGTELCCPQKGTCCPQGEEVVARSAEGVAVCCPQGMKVIEGTTKCCLNTFYYSDVFRQCVGLVKFDRIPTSTKEVKQLCADRNSSPVKIENEDQNTYLRGEKFRNALIGLAIPDDQEWAEDGFQWLVDGSKPTFTNWDPEQPNNGDGMSDEIESLVASVTTCYLCNCSVHFVV